MIYVDRVFDYSERLNFLQGWFLEERAWEEFCDSAAELPDPGDFIADAALLAQERLGEGDWVVPGTALYSVAALLAIGETGWAEVEPLVQDALQEVLRDARLLEDEDEAYFYHLVLSEEVEE